MISSTKNVFCKKCKLHEAAAHPMILGRGNPNASVLLLGEAPGKTEDEQGQVFIGKSGQLLQNKINFVDLDCFVSNSCLCRPKDKTGGNATPTPTQIELCKPTTIDLILTMKPRVIVTLGAIAMQQLLGFSMNMEISRGKEFYHNVLDVTVIPTYHPAYLLRTNDSKFMQEFTNDLALAKKISNKPRARRILSNPVSYKDRFDIEKYLNELKKSESFSVDLETTSLDPRKGRITDISFCNAAGRGVHIEWKYIADKPELLDLLREALASPAEKIFHNADFDMRFLRSIGINVPGKIFDTMLAYHSMTMSYEGGKSAMLYRLKTMTWFMTQEGGYEDVLEDVGGIVGAQEEEEKEKETKKKKKKDVDQGSLFDDSELAKAAGFDPEYNTRLLYCDKYIASAKEERLKKLGIGRKAFYSAMDADVTFRIYKYLKQTIDSLYNYPFYNITMPLCKTLMRIHENGIMIDIPYVDAMIAENNEVAESVKKEFFKEAKYEFNINSTEQLREFMYDKLKLQVNPKYVTAKGKQPSTDEEAIVFFSEKKPILKKILDYRGVNKQTTTYFEGYKKLADENGRVYPSYLQIGTASGRLSARDPNLQNIPRDNRVRNMVIAPPGHKIIISDLSQIELRILAMIADDTNMINAFRSGLDLHAYTACLMFGIPVETFSKKIKEHDEKRTIAKTINFGIVYQMRAESLANSLEIPLEKAQTFMKRFFEAYPKVPVWVEYIKAFARANGYVETIYGRRRYLPYIRSSESSFREGAERQAVNCVDELTEVLTSRGWLRYSDLTNHDSILTKNMNSGELEWEIPTNISVFPEYEGDIIEFTSKSFSAVTTPKHRWLVTDSNSKSYEVTSETMSIRGHHRIHRTGIYNKETSIYSDNFVNLIGWVLTDGYFKNSKEYNTSGIGVCQSLRANSENVDRIDSMFAALQIKTYRSVKKESECVYWEFYGDIAKNIRELFPKRQLTVSFLMSISYQQACSLMNIMLSADGTVELHKNNSIKKRVYYASTEEKAGLFQILCTLCGYASTYKWRASEDRSYVSPKLKQPILHSKGIWLVSILNRKTVQVVEHQKKVYNKKMIMWCPTVPNTFFVARRLGKVYITGNTPIQSAAGDVCFTGMCRFQDWLDTNEKKTRIIGTVHDSILTEAPDEEVEEIAVMLPKIMTTDIPRITIDIKADVDILEKWKK